MTRKKKKPKQKTAALLISYVPLLDYEDVGYVPGTVGLDVGTMEKLSELMASGNGQADGCLWVQLEIATKVLYEKYDVVSEAAKREPLWRPEESHWPLWRMAVSGPQGGKEAAG